MEAEGTTFIYVLSDPLTGIIRYVGKANDPFDRFRRHQWVLSCEHRLPKTRWVNKLRKQGMRPHMDILDEVPISEWQFWETEYIRVFRMLGLPLLNVTEGGDGVGQSRRGIPRSKETCEKMRVANLGRTFSPEHLEKLRAAKKGKPWTAARRAACERRAP